MIEDLLETTRLESGRLRLSKSHFDVGRLAEVVTAQLETTASRPIRCETSGPAPVLADSGRIERVLENLIGNALRYSPPHSPITVRVEAQGPEAIVRVVDSGIGIPTDEIPKLFQRFQRVKGNDSGAGLGLGLYNSRLIIDHHGGRIWAESTPGAGSTFGFALPTAAGCPTRGNRRASDTRVDDLDEVIFGVPRRQPTREAGDSDFRVFTYSTPKGTTYSAFIGVQNATDSYSMESPREA